MKEINLILKKVWFEAYLKRYEYREIKPYYSKMFCACYDPVYYKCKNAKCWNCKYFTSKSFDRIILHCGYTSNIRIYNRIRQYKVEIANIDKTDWQNYSQQFIKDGYDPNKKYFRTELFF